MLCVQPQVVQSRQLERGERFEHEVRERGAAPKRKRVAKPLRSRRWVGRRTRLRGEKLELAEVYLLARRHDRVPGCPGDEQVGAELLPQLGHDVLQRLARCPRRMLAPEVIEQSVG